MRKANPSIGYFAQIRKRHFGPNTSRGLAVVPMYRVECRRAAPRSFHTVSDKVLGGRRCGAQDKRKHATNHHNLPRADRLRSSVGEHAHWTINVRLAEKAANSRDRNVH